MPHQTLSDRDPSPDFCIKTGSTLQPSDGSGSNCNRDRNPSNDCALFVTRSPNRLSVSPHFWPITPFPYTTDRPSLPKATHHAQRLPETSHPHQSPIALSNPLLLPGNDKKIYFLHILLWISSPSILTIQPFLLHETANFSSNSDLAKGSRSCYANFLPFYSPSQPSSRRHLPITPHKNPAPRYGAAFHIRITPCITTTKAMISTTISSNPTSL